jgi:hypothetical protein
MSNTNTSRGVTPAAPMANPFSGLTVGEETWLTPKYLIDALGPFDLDPATPPNMPWKTAMLMLTKNEDGLATPWSKSGFTFCNPPYGRETEEWLKKAAAHGNGITLIFARTETRGFQKFVWKHPNTTGLFFFERRLKFCRVDGKEAGSAGAPSVLVAYGQEARRRIERAAALGLINGVLVDPPKQGVSNLALAKAA